MLMQNQTFFMDLDGHFGPVNVSVQAIDAQDAVHQVFVNRSYSCDRFDRYNIRWNASWATLINEELAVRNEDGKSCEYDVLCDEVYGYWEQFVDEVRNG